MIVYELTRNQLIELKQDYLFDHSESLSYNELANADELVSDDTVFDEYSGTEFTEEDFSLYNERRKTMHKKSLTQIGAKRLAEEMNNAWQLYSHALEIEKAEVEVRFDGERCRDDFYSLKDNEFLYKRGAPYSYAEWHVLSTWIQYQALVNACTSLCAEWRRTDGKHDVFA